MAFSRADFVQQTTNTTGTGTYSLSGSVGGRQDFLDGNASGSTVRYSVTDGTNWEVAEGILTSGQVTRATVIASSNSGAAINWSAGDKFISQVLTASEVDDLATESYVDSAVAAVVDSSPEALDTLNELAAALGDDPNFATTTAASIGEKLAKASNLSDLANAATARTNLGLGTAATTNSTAYATAAQGTLADSALQSNETITLSGDVSGSGTTSITVTVADDSHNHIISNVDGLQNALDGKLTASSYNANDVLSKLLTVDGASSGLDADLLDGQQGTYYAAASSLSNYLPLSGGTLTGNLALNSNRELSFNSNSLRIYGDSGYSVFVDNTSNGFYFISNDNIEFRNINNDRFIYGISNGELELYFDGSRKMKTVSSGIEVDGTVEATGGTSTNWNTAYGWGNHASAGYITGNQTITLSGDVSGSGTTNITVTVADDSHNHIISNVDGLQAALDGKVDDSQVLTNVPSGAVFTDTTYSVGNGGLTEINFTSALNSKLAGIEAGATADQTASEILTAVKTVDGSGSGLDADLLDGQQGSYYAAASSLGNYLPLSGGTLTGNITLQDDNEGIIFNGGGRFYKQVGQGLVIRKPVGGQELRFEDNSGTFIGTFWHSGNDGSGSGLDADLLDGQHASAFASVSHNHSGVYQPAGTYNTIIGTDSDINTSGSTIIDNIFVTDGVITSMGTRTLTAGDLGALTGNQTITLSGDITGSGTTSINAQIASNVVGANELNVSGNGTAGQMLTSDGDGSMSWADAASGGGITYIRKTANYTASAGEGIIADTSGGTFTVTLPSSPSLGDVVIIADGDSWASINLTVGRNGSTIDDVADNMLLDVTGVSVEFVYDGTTWLTYVSAGEAGLQNIVEDTTPQLGGDLASNGNNIRIADNDFITFGTGNDAELFCDGSHFYLDLNSGIGNFYIRDGSTTRFTFDDAGSFTATGNVTAYSDRRLKDDIQKIEGAVEKVQQLSGNTYTRNDLPDTERRYAGVIAQEVETVLPEAVSEAEDGTKTVDYNATIALLVEAVKELKAEIDELKGAK